ncbi:PREDICTED: mitochondrial fission 1 protein-like, partial [Rhagoletis zephyria]|uniref:mitochondrial fission 1 protein-like n=1 Tax=Rhagoletis zephyria TaxID=28612 RepID=UPI000811A3A6
MSYEKVSHLLNDHISSEDMGMFTTKYNTALRSGNCPPATRFEYALALTRSRYKGDHLRAVNILEDLCVSGDPDVFRDYLYYLTIVNIKLQNFERARDCINKFLSVEPENRQAKDLKEYIESKVFREGVKGLAI